MAQDDHDPNSPMTPREAAIEAMAMAMFDADQHNFAWEDIPSEQAAYIKTATVALDALHRWTDAQGLALAVPRVTTEEMAHAALNLPATGYGLGLYQSVYTAMIAAAPDVLGEGE